jgi:sirohydrochlorin ferrochelatase
MTALDTRRPTGRAANVHTAPALVAVAHGSRDPRAARATEALVARIRAARPGLEVRAAFLEHAGPRPAQVVAELDRPSVAVPLLLTAAYHSKTDLPAQLGAATVPVAQASALGPHSLLLRALDRRLAEAGVTSDDRRTRVVLAAAGSTDPEALATVRAVATGWSRASGRDVRAAFASAAQPDVGTAVAQLRRPGGARVAVAAYLLFPGRFSSDLARTGADVVSAPLADTPEVAELALLRYDAAVAAASIC